ncbi:hypothetical protein TRVA0_024S00936 [Trichomonascus vanleenenianus]|uniref:uncharacterized protein n=1 Tax=Trichomonascus vanleenenianus TaxID=2268995 RepID=UPI003EC9DEA4
MEHFEHSLPLSAISTVLLADHDLIDALGGLNIANKKEESISITQSVGSTNSSSADLDQALSDQLGNDQAPRKRRESQPIDRTPLLRNTQSKQVYHIFGSEGEQLIEVVDDYGADDKGPGETLYTKTYDPFNAGPNLRPYAYPDGYFCFKCRNTGIVVNTNKPCKRCFRKFSPQRVKHGNRLVSRLLPRSAMWIDTGGGYCSRCRGSGQMKHWPGRSASCTVCEGSGIWP